MFIYKPQLFMELMIVSVLLSGLAALMGSTADTTAGSVFYGKLAWWRHDTETKMKSILINSFPPG